MSKWMSKILAPRPARPRHDHIATEDIARLVEGSVAAAEREQLLGHINRCPRCYEILDQTVKDEAFFIAAQPTAVPWWKSKITYALAASLILVFAISGQLIYQFWADQPGMVTATLDLDQPLKDILLENQALQFGKGPRLSRLLAALQRKGLQVKQLDRAILSKSYYQKKSLFGPREVLHIRIENGVVYLEVEEIKESSNIE